MVGINGGREVLLPWKISLANFYSVLKLYQQSFLVENPRSLWVLHSKRILVIYVEFKVSFHEGEHFFGGVQWIKLGTLSLACKAGGGTTKLSPWPRLHFLQAWLLNGSLTICCDVISHFCRHPHCDAVCCRSAVTRATLIQVPNLGLSSSKTAELNEPLFFIKLLASAFFFFFNIVTGNQLKGVLNKKVSQEGQETVSQK